ncbi:MAG: YajD family HNH nuclease [Granulosicoccus sp.]
MQSDDKSRKLDQIVADARASYESRESGYRQRALKLYPWVCGRCMREFNQSNLRELTVHHRDHDHDNNPQDGSNWELLCVFCHDNEHQRLVEEATSSGNSGTPEATHNPFADLQDMLGKRNDD